MEVITSLGGTQWQVIDIDGTPPLAHAAPTLEIDKDLRISGSSGCNRFFGAIKTESDALTLRGIGATQMACTEEKMEQEQRFLDALTATTQMTHDASGQLLLSDNDGRQRLLLTPTESIDDPVPPTPQDLPSGNSIQFQCDALERVEFRFLGPETIELTVNDQRHVLQHQVSASGARYAADDIQFWNKGEQALLTLGERDYSCTRNSSETPGD